MAEVKNGEFELALFKYIGGLSTNQLRAELYTYMLKDAKAELSEQEQQAIITGYYRDRNRGGNQK